MEWLKFTIDYGVLGLLLIMSIISVAIALERRNYYKNLTLNDFNDKKTLELELTRRLHIIAIIGHNAPYIGLLGTVLGIILTFYTIGQQGIVESAKIMKGLALALKATAAGLLVAIPSATMYNLAMRKVKETMLRWESKNG